MSTSQQIVLELVLLWYAPREVLVLVWLERTGWLAWVWAEVTARWQRRRQGYEVSMRLQRGIYTLSTDQVERVRRT
jgi:hypothetical protein